MFSQFQDRRHAGRVLEKKLSAYSGRNDIVVLALPRGGVPVAFEIARGLRAPLDIFLVRKLGVPEYPELAMGAIASGGVQILNKDIIEELSISEETIAAVRLKEEHELLRREQAYRGKALPLFIEGRIAILVDDGLATGATMKAAVAALRKQRPAQTVIAVPVSSEPACRELASEVDEIICAFTPEPFHGVGQWYEDFSPTTDDEVRQLLREACEQREGAHYERRS
jgi:putative phosphoribosyl transferase